MDRGREPDGDVAAQDGQLVHAGDGRDDGREAARLIKRVQAGDERAFEELYRRYHQRIFTYAHFKLGDWHEAEDVAQTVFLKALEELPSFDPEGPPFIVWLLQVTRNHIINLVQKHRPVYLPDPALAELAGAADVPWGESGEADEPRAAVVLGALEALPASQRNVISLRYAMDLSWNEVAESVGCSPDAARQLHQRAMRTLRRQLGSPGQGEPGAATQRHGFAARTFLRQAPVLRARRFALTA